MISSAYKYNLIISLFLYSSVTLGGEVLQSHVSHKDGVYDAWLEMQISAAPDKVYALLTDFNNLTKLSDAIIQSTLISSKAPEYIVIIKTHNCVLFFCKDLQQTQRVIELKDGHIMVEDIKGKSDFIFADTIWQITPYKKGTLVTFATTVKPDFWLPPLIGPMLFKSRLIEETQHMIERMELLARDDQTLEN